MGSIDNLMIHYINSQIRKNKNEEKTILSGIYLIFSLLGDDFLKKSNNCIDTKSTVVTTQILQQQSMQTIRAQKIFNKIQDILIARLRNDEKIKFDDISNNFNQLSCWLDKPKVFCNPFEKDFSDFPYNDLPLEIKLRIISFLPIKEIGRSAQINKEHESIYKDAIIKSVNRNQVTLNSLNMEFNQIKKILEEKGNHLRYFNFTETSNGPFELLKFCSNLKHKILNNKSSTLPYKIADNKIKITVLTFYPGDEPISILKDYTHKNLIETLDLKTDSLRDIDIQAIATNFTFLRKLKIHKNERITDAGFIHTINLKLLQKLYIRGNEIGDTSIQAIANNLRYLKKLKLPLCSRITDVGVLCIANNLKLLQKLDLRNVNKISDKGIQAIAENLRFLRNLKLSKCEKITNAGILHIANDLKLLQKLDLRSVSKINDKGIQAIAENLRFLKKLSLSIDLRDTTVQTLKKNLIFLQTLNFNQVIYSPDIYQFIKSEVILAYDQFIKSEGGVLKKSFRLMCTTVKYLLWLDLIIPLVTYKRFSK